MDGTPQKARRWGRRTSSSITGVESDKSIHRKDRLRRTRYFTEKEVEKILSVAKLRGDEVFITILVGIASGCRVGELVQMRVSDWNFNRGFVEVRDSKKDGRKRITPFQKDEGDYVQRFIKENKLKPDDIIFQMSSKTYNRWVKSLSNEAGIDWNPEIENIRWHSFRGTFVRTYRRRGRDDVWLSQATGDDPRTLYEYYSEYTPEDMVEIHRGD